MPHGSPARVMQYLAPIICLFAGIGSADLLGLCVIHGATPGDSCGSLLFCPDWNHPRGFRCPSSVPRDPRKRHASLDFGRKFATMLFPYACAGLGVAEWDSTNLNVAVYLCNQMIYSPQRQHRQERAS